MIETENLTKIYNENRAVDGLNLEVEKGDIFGFLGPNGAGKSTTILMLVGMIEPTAGKRFINGIDIARDPLGVKRIIGYLPEDVGFYGNITGEQNLDYFARFYGMNPAERTARIKELLELVHLDGVTQKAGEYSRGMKQRLGLAQALINDPMVLFLDEPTANLDPEGVFQYRELIARLADEGKTIFVSSHILSEVTQVCRTIGIISKGKLVAEGPIEDLKNQLSRLESGKMNIIVETVGPVPEIAHEDVLEADYDGNTAVFHVTRDIRDEISPMLYQKGAVVREIMLEQPTLEDIFLSIYRS